MTFSTSSAFPTRDSAKVEKQNDLRHPQLRSDKQQRKCKNHKTQKTIVFSFDGTGNEPSGAGEFLKNESITNVLKLHLLLGGGIGEDGAVFGDGEGRQLAF